MASHLNLLVTAISGGGPVVGNRDVYEVHLATQQTPGGAGLNLTLQFHTTAASTLLSLLQGNPPKAPTR
jgi:hypothetical protein